MRRIIAAPSLVRAARTVARAVTRWTAAGLRWRGERPAADVPAEHGAVPRRQRARCTSSRTATARWSTTCCGSRTRPSGCSARSAIREGYEVGDHGAQSLYRVGCRVQLTDVEAHPDGTFDIVAVGLRPDPARPARHQRHLPGRARHAAAGRRPAACPPRSLERARATFTAYRAALSRDPRPTPTRARCPATRRTSPGRWPPSRRCRCPSGRRCSRPRTPAERLILVTDLLRSELRAMNVIPSLPATEVARTRWSPN